MSNHGFHWRGSFTNDELNRLHAEAFRQPLSHEDWVAQVNRHSLGWVTARDGTDLIGFVNVPWDGGCHAFIMDTIVTARVRRRGVGTRLVELAAEGARAAGCEHLHVDFEEHLRPFYLDSCKFRPTPAGLRSLAPDTVRA